MRRRVTRSATGVALAAALLAACSSKGSSSSDAASVDPDATSDGRARDSWPLADAAPPPDWHAADTAPQPAELSAGAAAVTFDLTALGAPLGGYGGEPRRLLDPISLAAHVQALQGNCTDPTPADAAALFAPATGTHDPLTARALVLRSGTSTAAIVKVDAIGISRLLRDDLAGYAESFLGIPPERLVVAATHTHSGPGAVSENQLWQLIAMDCFHQATYDALLARVKEALFKAHAALAPARLGIATTQQPDVSRNRTGRPGVVDRELGLIKVERAHDASPVAAVLNFAIHGTCLGADNLLFSGDVMGHAERTLDEQLGGVALFLNGAEGDVSPAQSGHEGAAALGATIAATVQQLWQTTAVKELLSLDGALADVPLPPVVFNACLPIGDHDLCDLVATFNVPVQQWLPASAPFAALRIDDVVLAMVPGEPITDIGLQIKLRGTQLGFRHTFVVGLANDHIGYISTAAEYARDIYESQMTFYGPTTGQHVVDALAARMQAVAPSP